MFKSFLLFLAFFLLVARSKCAPPRLATSRLPGVELSLKKTPLPPAYEAYILAGKLHLPLAGVTEPFKIYFDNSTQSKRVEYYGGMTTTIQHHATMYKLVYVTKDDVRNKRTCYIVDADDQPMTPVGLPQLESGFIYQGETTYKGGRVAARWFNSTTTQSARRLDHEFLCDIKTGEPLEYNVKMFNLPSEKLFDSYTIEYFDYNPTRPNPKMFDPPADLDCGPMEEDEDPFYDYDDAVKKNVFTKPHMDPLSEFIHTGTDWLFKRVDGLFNKFKHHHSKKYDSPVEHDFRKAIFHQNLRYIESVNRAGHSYRLAVNHLADRTPEEQKRLRGLKTSENGDKTRRSDSGVRQENVLIPDSFDWRDRGAVTPVQDQGDCGSCWSFAAGGAIEGAYFVKTGKLIPLSRQELIDCSWGEDNYGCDGGDDVGAYKWVMKNGIASDDSYGGYLSRDGYCKMDNVTALVNIADYELIPRENITAFQLALLERGPVAVSINSSPRSFTFYADGIYDDTDCLGYTSDHAVLIVGYGVRDGNLYWILKNTWSPLWGIKGYMYIAANIDNICGVMTSPSQPIIER